MGDLYNEYLFEPLFNLLIWLYNVIPGHDIGLAIIAITLIIRLILYPLSKKAYRSQKAMQALQPKMKELQEKYKDKRDELARAMMALYKENKVKPFAGFLPILIQLPVLIALYQVFTAGLSDKSLELLYSFVQNPGQISHLMFGFFDLATPSVPLALVVGLAQIAQGKIMFKYRPIPKSANQDPNKPDMQKMMQVQMTYFLPVLTVIFSLNLPAALAVYWLVTTLFTIAQEIYFFRTANAKTAVAVS